jgi:hypothetical protein
VVYEGGDLRGLPEVTEKSHPEVTENGLLIREDQKKDQKKDQTTAAASSGDEMKIETPWMQGKAKKANEVVEKHNEKAKKRFSDEGLMAAMDRAEACPSAENLEKLFLVAWVAGGFGYRRKLPKKERGQLIELIEACASTELGVYLIVDSVKNWNLLAAHLKKVMKSSSPPETPNLGYLLAAHVAVLSWVAKRAKETAMQALAPGAKADGGGWGKFK